jgi:hypothetical protein
LLDWVDFPDDDGDYKYRKEDARKRFFVYAEIA